MNNFKIYSQDVLLLAESHAGKCNLHNMIPQLIYIHTNSMLISCYHSYSRFDLSAQSQQPSSKPSLAPSRQPSMIPSTGPSPPPSSGPSGGPSTVPSASPNISPTESPSNRLSVSPSAQPSNCPSLPPYPDEDCQCVDNTNNSNLALFGCGHSLYTSERGYLHGPLDGVNGTSFSELPTLGSTYESTDDNVVHWWEVDLRGVFTIAQIKIFACDGPLCDPDGAKLDQIRVDIYRGLVRVSSSYFHHDHAPVLSIILPVEVQGQTVRVTKMQTGKVLSLSEVQVIGR